MTRAYFKERFGKLEIRTANLPNTSQKHRRPANPLTEKLTVVELVMKLSVLYVKLNFIVQGRSLKLIGLHQT